MGWAKVYCGSKNFFFFFKIVTLFWVVGFICPCRMPHWKHLRSTFPCIVFPQLFSLWTPSHAPFFPEHKDENDIHQIQYLLFLNFLSAGITQVVSAKVSLGSLFSKSQNYSYSHTEAEQKLKHGGNGFFSPHQLQREKKKWTAAFGCTWSEQQTQSWPNSGSIWW